MDRNMKVIHNPVNTDFMIYSSKNMQTFRLKMDSSQSNSSPPEQTSPPMK